MKLPTAIKARGRFSLALFLAGDEESSACFLPDVRPFCENGALRESDLDGADRQFNPDGGVSVLFSMRQLESAPRIGAFIGRRLAEGKASALSGAFDAVLIVNDVFEVEDGVRHTLAVRYASCSVTLLKDGRLKLSLIAPGVPGTLFGDRYEEIDDCFEGGWLYD